MAKKIMFNDKYLLTQAVLCGAKTMTRRVLKVPKTCNGKEVCGFNVLTNSLGIQCVDLLDFDGHVLDSWKPHYEVGEVMAIAQCYRDLYPNADFEMVGNGFMTESAGWTNKMFVRADFMIHHVRITDIKVERLQDITEEDALKEGICEFAFSYYLPNGYGKSFNRPHEAFAYLIDMVSGKGTWESNPWVVAYSFELID